MKREIDALELIFMALGIGYRVTTVDEFSVDWYGYPKDWLGNKCINAVAAEFVFDATGRFLGVGTGDPQTSVDYRVLAT